MSPLAICPADWPSASYGNIRSTLLSLKWQEHDGQTFLTPSGEYAVFFEHGKWLMTREADFEFLVEMGKGETREELCELLMTLGLMPEPQAYSEADECDRKYHEMVEGA